MTVIKHDSYARQPAKGLATQCWCAVRAERRRKNLVIS